MTIHASSPDSQRPDDRRTDLHRANGDANAANEPSEQVRLLARLRADEASAADRQLALIALEDVLDTAAVPALITALQTDADATVRRLAVERLEDLGDARGAQALVGALD